MNNLVLWYQAAEDLKAAKKLEMELRKAVVEEYFETLDEGTNRIEIPEDPSGARLVATLPYSYSLDADEIEAGLELVPKTKRDKLVIYRPGLDKRVYNGLSKKARTEFTAQCITVKPGTPSLKIEVPK